MTKRDERTAISAAPDTRETVCRSFRMHTPGPWRIRQDNAPEGEPLRIECDARGVIAELAFTGGEEEATARLIAAAPELAACLREVTHELDICYSKFGNTSGTVRRAREALIQAGVTP